MTKIPKILCHYTTAKGLLGIVGSNTLWASDLRCMNDLSELRYASKLVGDTMKKSLQDNRPDLLERLPDDPFRISIIVEAFTGYAICFCEMGDQLSQWRAYSTKGGFWYAQQDSNLRPSA